MLNFLYSNKGEQGVLCGTAFLAFGYTLQSVFQGVLCLIIVGCFTAFVQGAEPFIVDEGAIMSSFEKTMGLMMEKRDVPTGRALLAQSAERLKVPVNILPTRSIGSMKYEKLVQSIAIVCSLYKCDKCESWHRGGYAVAWVASSKGVLVTNAHVLSSLEDKRALGVCFVDGQTYPVMEILSVDNVHDIAIIKIEATHLKPLPLGPTPEVGAHVGIISHPEGRFYVMTQGEVARYYKKSVKPFLASHSVVDTKETKNTLSKAHKDTIERAVLPEYKENHVVSSENKIIWMNVTADFARGSSGAPVLDTLGRVVGMVSYNQTIYATSNNLSSQAGNSENKGDMQMCLRSCVTVEALKKILKTSRFSR